MAPLKMSLSGYLEPVNILSYESKVTSQMGLLRTLRWRENPAPM